MFCSTHNRDNAWTAIKKYLEKKHIPSEFFTSIKENGINHLAESIDRLRLEENEDSEEEEIKYKERPNQVVNAGYKTFDEIHVKIKKPKKVSQRYMIIFDDVSGELRDPNVSILLKTNRHFRPKCVISSQNCLDIDPQTRKQIEYYILFSGLNDDKLYELYRNADLDIGY